MNKFLFTAVAKAIRSLLGLKVAEVKKALRTYYLTPEGRVTGKKPRTYTRTVRAASLADALGAM